MAENTMVTNNTAAQAGLQTGEQVKPFGMSDRIGYMLGDLGNDLFFGLVSGYLMLFYTDILGIGAGAIGTLLIVARIWDAVNDPMIGTFIDRRGGKISRLGGKFRPYLLYAALPVTIMGFLSFTAFPGLAEGLKLPYAYVTYIMFGMAYTFINIPYGSLASVMTSDPVERTSLSTFRTIGALVANVVIMTVVPALVFQNGVPTASGFMIAAGLFVILSNICYFGAFKLTRERIQHPHVEKPKQKLSDTIKTLAKNRPLVGLMIASFGMLASMMAVSALTPYLYKDYFQAPELITLGGLVGLLSSFIILPFIGKLVKKFGKKELAAGTMVIAIGGNLILFLLPITNPYIFMGVNFIASIGLGFFNVLIWALVGDAIDYQEYITGNREEGIVYASYSLVRKLGQAVAGGIGGFALTFIGYQAGQAVQTAEVALGIKNVITALPLMTTIISFIAMVFVYNLSKDRLANMTAELTARRQTK
ncbi:MAG: MFS transporter [Culicoidibacterales bacterium]